MLPARRSGTVASALATAMRAGGGSGSTAHPSSVCLVDLRMLELRAAQWKEHLPRVTPHYAVKCNPDPAVAGTLAAAGVNFDCASVAEVDLVTQQLGVSPDRVVYAHPCKPPAQLAHAAAAGVQLTVVDGEEELAKVADLAPAARVLLRIKVDDTASAMPFSAKFGAELSAVPHLLSRAAALGVSIVGVSYHVGSGCSDVSTYGDAVAAAAHVFRLGAAHGHAMTVLNVGGGYPGDAPGHAPVHALPAGFADVAAALNAALEEHFPEGRVDPVSRAPVTVMAEPGRYFASACQTMATPIVAVRRGGDPAGDGMARLYLDDGVYGSFNCVMFDHRSPRPALLPASGLPLAEGMLAHAAPVGGGGEPAGAWERASVWGPTCDSLDCIVRDVALPVGGGAGPQGALGQGDWLVWDSMGAYTNAAASAFNGFAPATRLYVPADAAWDFEVAAAPRAVHVPALAREPG